MWNMRNWGMFLRHSCVIAVRSQREAYSTASSDLSFRDGEHHPRYMRYDPRSAFSLKPSILSYALFALSPSSLYVNTGGVTTWHFWRHFDVYAERNALEIIRKELIKENSNVNTRAINETIHASLIANHNHSPCPLIVSVYLYKF